MMEKIRFDTYKTSIFFTASAMNIATHQLIYIGFIFWPGYKVYEDCMLNYAVPKHQLQQSPEHLVI